MKKIIFILILFFSCYIIYYLTTDSKVNYLTLGDSLSSGINIYGIKEYGYSDYIKDYLYDKDRLKNFNDDFANSNYRITDLTKMIKYNETKKVNGKNISINKVIKSSDIITLSIGMTELYSKLKINNINIYNYMNELILDMDKLLAIIDRFEHEKVFVLGYYNVGISQEYINYINVKLRNVVEKYGFDYVDLSNIFDNNPIYFDKNDSFIPNNEGYLKISKIIIEKIENN